MGSAAARVLPLPLYVSARDVQRQLGCSQAHAYDLLHAAGARKHLGLLRLRLDLWQHYLDGDAPCLTDSTSATAPGTPGGTTPMASGGTRARSKRTAKRPSLSLVTSRADALPPPTQPAKRRRSPTP